MSRRESGRREVVVITGASAGVGRATARKFAAHGARVALIARGLDGLRAARIEVEALGGEALLLPVDVASAEEVNEAARVIAHTLGPIDVWINSAVTSVFSPVGAMTAGDYGRVTQVTYLGTVHGTLAALAQMRPRNQGVIVQVSSPLAYRSVPLQSAYCAAKRAVVGFTESLQAELLHERSNVRVAIVDLPAMNTPQFDWVKSRLPRPPRPVPPVYQPEVAAKAIFHVVHHDRRRMEVGAPRVESVLGSRMGRIVGRLLARRDSRALERSEPAELAELPELRRPSNLWAPVRGDHGAHGRFGERARSHSFGLWADMHRGFLAVAAAAFAATVWMGVRSLRTRV